MNLRISLMQSEEESEKIAEGFLSGLLTVYLMWYIYVLFQFLLSNSNSKVCDGKTNH